MNYDATERTNIKIDADAGASNPMVKCDRCDSIIQGETPAYAAVKSGPYFCRWCKLEAANRVRIQQRTQAYLHRHGSIHGLT